MEHAFNMNIFSISSGSNNSNITSSASTSNNNKAITIATTAVKITAAAATVAATMTTGTTIATTTAGTRREETGSFAYISSDGATSPCFFSVFFGRVEVRRPLVHRGSPFASPCIFPYSLDKILIFFLDIC